MHDREPDPYTVEWRVGQLEKRQDELVEQAGRQLAEHRLATDALIKQCRDEMRNDYMTSDQAEIRYVSRDSIRQGGIERREWLIAVIMLGQIALIALQIFHH